MNITYRVTRKLAFQVNWTLHWWTLRQSWVGGMATSALLIWFGIFAKRPDLNAAALMILWLHLLMGLLLVLLGLISGLVGAFLPGVAGTHHDTLTPEGLLGLDAGGRERLLPWAKVRVINQTPNGLVFLGRLAAYIPRAAFASPEAEAAFVEEARALHKAARRR